MSYANVSSKVCDGLAIVTEAKWLPFSQVRQLEQTCLVMCHESRRQVARKARVMDDTPATLWSGLYMKQGSSDRRVTAGAAVVKTNPDISAGGAGSGSNKRPAASDGRTSWSNTTRTVSSIRKSRVPLVRVTALSWGRSADELRKPGFRWPEGVKALSFGPLFKDSLEGVALPDTLEEIAFGFHFNAPLTEGRVAWPSNLKKITMGARWDRPLTDTIWPVSLQTLRFGSHFNRMLTSARGHGAIAGRDVVMGLPRGLREIHLGGEFNRMLYGLEWPPGLEKLQFSDRYNCPLAGRDGLGRRVVWPPRLRELIFGHDFNQPLRDVQWPESLQIIVVGSSFDRPLHDSNGSARRGLQGRNHAGVATKSHLPPRLKELTLGKDFLRGLNPVDVCRTLERLQCFCSINSATSVSEWPPGLTHLSCHLNFGAGRTLPPRLEVFRAGREYNFSLRRLAFPTTLRVLDLGDEFDKPLVSVAKFPDGLEELRLGRAFKHDIAGANWQLPRGLKRLIFDDCSAFDRDITSIDWPPCLEELKFGNVFNQSFEGVRLPNGLRELWLGWSFSYSLQAVELPQSLQVLGFGPDYSRRHIRALVWPRCLRRVARGPDTFCREEDMARWAAPPPF